MFFGFFYELCRVNLYTANLKNRNMATIQNGQAAAARPKRIMALDVMRGLTIVCMIIVNNAGGPESYAQLRHSEWNGLTVCDLVFPFFLFIMGVTTYLSMAGRGFKADGPTVRKILRRTLVILLICWALHWFDGLLDGRGWFDFSRLRLTGVLTRIALCYCAVSFLALILPMRGMIIAAVALTAGYGALLLTGNGFDNDLSNINNIIDRFLLAPEHMYTKRPVDPEGLLGTLPAIAHTIVGFCCGAIIKSRAELSEKLLRLMVCGALLMAAGWMASSIFPLNKRVWSPSYLMVTCGMAATLLATLSYFIDMRGERRPFTLFEAFGVNPLFLYVLAEAIGPIASSTGLRASAYGVISAAIADPCAASAVYSIALALITGAVAIPLYRRRIYIKI